MRRFLFGAMGPEDVLASNDRPSRGARTVSIHVPSRQKVGRYSVICTNGCSDLDSGLGTNRPSTILLSNYDVTQQFPDQGYHLIAPYQ